MRKTTRSQRGNGDLILLATNSVPLLAKEIARKSGMRLSPCKLGKYVDGEVSVEIGDDVRIRNHRVVIIGSTNAPAENLLEMIFLADAVRRAAATEIIGFIPYFGYSRQERKSKGHDAISAKRVTSILVDAGYNQLVTVDLHAEALQGFEDIPFANLWGRGVALKAALRHYGLNPRNRRHMDQLALVTPDHGAIRVGKYYAEKLGCMLIIAEKFRSGPNKVGKIVMFDGDKARGRVCIILDELFDTCGTIDGVSQQLVTKEKARLVAAAGSHGLFSGDAETLIEDGSLDAVFVTDTVARLHTSSKIHVVSAASMLALALKYVRDGGIVSNMYKQF